MSLDSGLTSRPRKNSEVTSGLAQSPSWDRSYKEAVIFHVPHNEDRGYFPDSEGSVPVPDPLQ